MLSGSACRWVCTEGHLQHMTFFQNPASGKVTMHCGVCKRDVIVLLGRNGQIVQSVGTHCRTKNHASALKIEEKRQLMRRKHEGDADAPDQSAKRPCSGTSVDEMPLVQAVHTIFQNPDIVDISNGKVVCRVCSTSKAASEWSTTADYHIGLLGVLKEHVHGAPHKKNCGEGGASEFSDVVAKSRIDRHFPRTVAGAGESPELHR